jgi:SAM-dependent methyltransferase
MEWVIITAVVLALCFGTVLLFGAPYLPTLGPQVNAALALASLQQGQTLIELGCGDGKMLVAAAKQGYKVVGYELNPLLYVLCKIRTRKYRQQVKVIWGNFWHKKWPQADAIFTFLLPRYMQKLDKKIMQSAPKPVKLVSFAFDVPGRQADAERDGVYLYIYQ